MAEDAKHTAIAVKQEGHIAIIRFNREKQSNAVNNRMYLELVDALKWAAAEDDIRVVVLTGSGKFFSAGADMGGSDDTDGGAGAGGELGQSRKHPLFAPVGLFMWEFINFPKPVIASVNGPAIGIGLTVLLHCDIVYCTQDTYFWTPFARIGVVPEFVSSLLMREILGNSVTGEMLYAQKKLSSSDAQRLGLVSNTFNSSEATFKYAIQTANEIASVPIADKTVRLFKRLLRPESRISQLQEYYTREMNALDLRFVNGETAEAVIAFLSSQREAKAKAKAATAKSKL